MRLGSQIRSWIRATFHRRRAESEMDDELRFHIDAYVEDLVRAGVAREEAIRRARIELGGVEQTKEECRDARGTRLFESLLQDIRCGTRMLRKSPGFTAVAVLTLALGTGANTAIFTLVRTTLLQSLPVRASGRLVVIWVNNLKAGWGRIGPTGQDYLDWKEQNQSFEELFLFEHGTGTVTGVGEPQQVAGLRVTTNFGDFFGIKPVVGRTFRVDEETARHNFAILGHRYWQERFASDPGVVGRGMTLNDEEYTIIGVLPPEVNTLFAVDVVVPFDNEWLKQVGSDLGVFGRLKRGVTLQQASIEMNMIMGRIARERPARKDYGAVLVPLESARVEYIRPAMLVLLGAAGFVLLISCANVANLLLSRAVGRRREVALRMALGAGRRRLIAQFVAESVLLGLLGGGAGFLLALWSSYVLVKLVPSRIPVPSAADHVMLPQVHMDATALAFTLLVALLTGVIFGLVPAFQNLRCDVNDSLREGERGFLSSRHGNRMRALLVVFEGALAFVLVIGAGLMLKSFSRLLAANPGFRSDHLLTLRIKLPNDVKDSKYKEPGQQAAAFHSFLAEVEAVPGIQSAALTQIVPLSQDDMDMGYYVIKEEPPLAPGQHLAADYRDISPDYFAAMGIPLIQGRTFTDRDNPDNPRVVIIDETLARRMFPNQDPIGKHLQVPDATRPEREIVGVVGGVRDTGFDLEPRPTIYFPFLQSPDQTMSLVVRTALPTATILPAIKDAIWRVDRNQPVFNVRTMEEIVADVTSAQRTASVALDVFAFLALALAAIGIYGVTSYAVGQRVHEIGTRMALGAQPADVMRLVLGHGLKLALGGLAVGLLAALAFTRWLSSLLYGVSATDPYTFLGVAILLGIVALAASYFPARRAMRVDPMVALRYE